MENVHLDINIAIICGLIINELVSNSIKYAFSEGKGQIYIDLKLVDHQLKLKVKDTGCGFPVDLDFETTDSMGLQMVNSLVSYLNGSIKLEIDSRN